MEIISKKRRWMATIALGATCGGVATASLDNRHATPLPRANAATEPMLQRVELDGADVARLLQLNAYKWNYTLPASGSGRVSLMLWTEEWSRHAARPTITGLGNLGLFDAGATKQRTLAIKLPHADDRELVVNTESSAFAAPLTRIAGLSGARSISAAEREPVALNRDIILVAATQNASGTYSSDHNFPDFTRRHDRTVFVKARFTRQAGDDNLGAPVWKGGKVVFE